MVPQNIAMVIKCLLIKFEVLEILFRNNTIQQRVNRQTMSVEMYLMQVQIGAFCLRYSCQACTTYPCLAQTKSVRETLVVTILSASLSATPFTSHLLLSALSIKLPHVIFYKSINMFVC